MHRPGCANDLCLCYSVSKKFYYLNLLQAQTGLEVIKLECSFKLKIKRNDWLLAERMNSSIITSRPGLFILNVLYEIVW